MRRTIVTCDVIGCGEAAYHEVDCCSGWMRDLCEKHWKEWAIATCKVLKMDKEIR